jgi:hypothetical protein
VSFGRAWLVVALLCSACATSGFTEKGVERVARGVTDSAGTPRRFALLVGIDAFDDARFTSLRFAGADARDLGAALTGYASVRVLSSPDETLRASILEQLEALGREATHPQDTVVVYFSTHGTLARRPGGQLERVIVTRDTRQDLLSETGLTVERVKALLEAMPARRKALVLALCHSGKGKSALPDVLTSQLSSSKAAVPFHEVSEGMLVLTACAFGETARESETVGHDLYTHGLLQALKQGDRDGDGAVTALEAHDFAREATFTLSEGAQRPTAEVELVGRDPVVLSGEVVRSSAPVLYSYAAAAEGLRLRVDGTVKGTFPGGFSLEPGAREVRIEESRTGAVLASTQLVLEPGARVDLSDALPPPPAWVVSLLPGVWFALDPQVVREAIPFSGGARLAVQRHFGNLAVSVTASELTGAGTLVGLGEGVPFRSHVLGLTAGLSWSPWPRLGLLFGAELGWLVLVRNAATRDFRSVQAVGSPTASGLVGWQRRVGRWFALGAQARLGVLGVGLDQRLAVTPVVGVEAFAGVVFPVAP